MDPMHDPGLAYERAAGRPEPSTGELVSHLTENLSQLLRDELRLAQVETSVKVKRAGVGVGIVGAAGLIALYGLAVLVAATVLALTLAVDAWLAAVIVGVVLLAVAGIAALVGKKRVEDAAPPVPTRTVHNVKEDVDAVRHRAGHRS
jgi:hypothetical protein